jgi:protein-disulfide isomerase
LTKAIEKNPDKIMEALQKAAQSAQKVAREKEMQEEQQAREEEYKNPKQAELKDDRAYRGSKDAPITIVEYSDFQCPFCAQLYTTIERAKAEFGNSLVVAVRNFPLISHEQAMPAAEAAECAAEQNKYWEMYHALFEANKSDALNIDQMSADAKKIGLDMALFTACLTKEKYKDKIVAEKAEVKDLGIIGTPASFLNNQYLPGALPYEDFTYPDGTPALGLRSLIQQKINETTKN